MFFFFFKQKTAYDMRISDWSSDVFSSDLKRTQSRPRRSARFHRTIRPLAIADRSIAVTWGLGAIMPPFRPHPMADEGGTDEAQACCSQHPISRAAETIRALPRPATDSLLFHCSSPNADRKRVG